MGTRRRSSKGTIDSDSTAVTERQATFRLKRPWALFASLLVAGTTACSGAPEDLDYEAGDSEANGGELTETSPDPATHDFEAELEPGVEGEAPTDDFDLEQSFDQLEAELARDEEAERSADEAAIDDIGQTEQAATGCWSGVVQPVYITPKGYKGKDRSASVIKVLHKTRKIWSKAGATFKVAQTINIKSKHAPAWFLDGSTLDKAQKDLRAHGHDDPNSNYVLFVEVQNDGPQLGVAVVDGHVLSFDANDITRLIKYGSGVNGAGVISHELSHTFGLPDPSKKYCAAFEKTIYRPAVCHRTFWPEVVFSNREFREMHCEENDRHFFKENCMAKFPKRARVCPNFKP